MDSPRLPSDRIGSQICHCAPPGGESPPDLSLRGSAGAAAISQYTPGTQESPGEFAGAYLRLPRRACALLAMTREGGTPKLVIVPLRMGKGPQACHCEAPQEPRQSRSTRRNTGKPRRIRRCLLEIATSGFALFAMTREGGTPKLVIVPLRMGKGPQACHCEAPQEPRQSRSTRRNTGKPRRIRRCLLEIAASGLRPPRNDTGGRHSQACHCAPPGGESPPDLSLRGSAGAAAISQYTPGTQESPGEFAGAYLRLPRRACALLAMTREGGTPKLVIVPLRMGKGPQACHCEAPQEPRQSRSTRRNTGKPRRIRRCLLEIATSACGLLAMTNPGACITDCTCQMRAHSPTTTHHSSPIPKIHTKEITPCSVRNAETRSGMTRNSARSAVRRCAVLSRLLLSSRKRPAQSRMPGKCLPSNRPFPA